MPQTTGLILSGGGARAAYQVGVLAAIGRMRRESGAAQGNPYPVISGTSAGAINAAFLASNADRFDDALDDLVSVWRNFQVEQVYRSDVLGMIRSGARWLSLLSLGWLIAQKKLRPKSLLNNDPLSQLLAQHIDFDRLPQLLEQGHLRALAITASSYSTGEHVTFYNSRHPVTPWIRNQRLAQHCNLTHDHLLASSAIPFIFPAMRLDGPQGNAYFGDGSMRQTAPISPAIHLGASKILVVGAGRMLEPPKKSHDEHPLHPPGQKPALADGADDLWPAGLGLLHERLAPVARKTAAVLLAQMGGRDGLCAGLDSPGLAHHTPPTRIATEHVAPHANGCTCWPPAAVCADDRHPLERLVDEFGQGLSDRLVWRFAHP